MSMVGRGLSKLKGWLSRVGGLAKVGLGKVKEMFGKLFGNKASAGEIQDLAQKAGVGAAVAAVARTEPAGAGAGAGAGTDGNGGDGGVQEMPGQSNEAVRHRLHVVLVRPLMTNNAVNMVVYRHALWLLPLQAG